MLIQNQVYSLELKIGAFFLRMGQFLKHSLWDCSISYYKYHMVALQVLSQHQIAWSIIPAYLDIGWALVAEMSHLPDCLV